MIKNKPLELFSLILLSLFPLAIIAGNFLINIFIFLFTISFFINFKENKILIKDKIFYLIIFFLISLILNVIFSTNPLNSIPRIIKMVLIIFFIFEIKRLIQNYEKNYMRNVFLTWFIIFIIVTFDVFFELTFSYNIIGKQSYMPGRIASFFGDELVVGAFYHGFVLFFLSYLFVRKSKNYILFISIICILFCSFFIGERSNFIKSFLSIIIFTLLVVKTDYKIKISGILILLTVMITLINFNQSYKSRYFYQIKTLFSINGYSKFIKQSQYGAHRNAAMKIFRENLIFGVGIKNFRYEVGKKKYENTEYLQTDKRQATHPHQIHHEFLSEMGIFGYLSCMIFLLSSIYIGIKRYFLSRNIFQLSGIIFVAISLLPLLPSGSFLSTYTSGIFWLNFALMISYTKKIKS